MPKRKIIKIDEEKCNGCRMCMPNCPEGAIQIIDRKARLVSDLFCDGLGACIGHCPQGAITVEERDAREYSEKKVMENIVKQGKNVIEAHLEHLKSHGQAEYLKEAVSFLKEKGIEIGEEKEKAAPHKHAGLFSGCPGLLAMDFRKEKEGLREKVGSAGAQSMLRQWPVQLMLVPASAAYLKGADLLIAADCVPFAYAGFHEDLLNGKILLVGCPKLDDTRIYAEKLKQIIENNGLKSITYAHMEVPCCFGLIGIIKQAIEDSAKDVPFNEIVISIKGARIK